MNLKRLKTLKKKVPGFTMSLPKTIPVSNYCGEDFLEFTFLKLGRELKLYLLKIMIYSEVGFFCDLMTFEILMLL